MVFVVKGMVIVFMLIGIPIALYGAWEIWETMNFVNASPGRLKAKFVGYNREYHKYTNIQSASDITSSHSTSYSLASYPVFTYRTEDGSERLVRESKVHLVEVYKAGEEMDVLLSPFFPPEPPRLAGFYSLYGRDMAILVLGFCFLLIPMAIWKVAVPSLETPEVSQEFTGMLKHIYGLFGELKVGPIPFRYILMGFCGFMVLGLLLAVIGGLAPFLAQMRFGAGGRLIAALEEKRFDDARTMVANGSGIHATNEYRQNPLLLALEAGQPELARMLIEAGADVNIKSKMFKTPLRVAVQSGDLGIVKLLLSRGASPDAPEDELPPFAYALAKGYEEIAFVLIEGGTDLHRRYSIPNRMATVGDMAVLARKPAVEKLIRQRGGSFSD